MADGDAQFQIGVVHGLADEPLYRWQDPFYQERYETGYTLGRWHRVTQGVTSRPVPCATTILAPRRRSD